MSKRILYQILQATQYFKTLSEIADKLYFSQPYLSKVLKKAEKDYGTTLIKRNSPPISLTNDGLLVLEHLQIILNTEDDLNHALKEANSVKPIKILVTNPFLYNLILDLMSPYISEHTELTFEISSYPVTDSLKAIQNQSFDIAVGRRYIDNQITTQKLPQNQVFSFISNKCSIYDPNKLILPFDPKSMYNLQGVKFISFENSAGIQNYIMNRFNEVGLKIRKTIKVDSVNQACLMAKSIDQSGHSAMSLVTNYVAEKVAGKGNYNLLSLPDNTLHLDNAIMFKQVNNNKINNLVDYLQEKVSENINEENKLLNDLK